MIDKRIEKVLWNKVDIIKRIEQLAQEVNNYYKDKEPPVVIGILKGSLVFLSLLVTKIILEIKVEFIAPLNLKINNKTIFSYQNQLKDLKNKNVLIINGIANNGLLLKQISNDFINKHQVADFKTMVLVDKINSHKVDYKVDWVGFKLQTNDCIVGWGIGWKNQLRYLPFIGKIKEKYKLINKE